MSLRSDRKCSKNYRHRKSAAPGPRTWPCLQRLRATGSGGAATFRTRFIDHGGSPKRRLRSGPIDPGFVRNDGCKKGVITRFAINIFTTPAPNIKQIYENDE